MRDIRGFLIGLLVAFSCAQAAPPKHVEPKKFAVGIAGKAGDRPSHAAQSSGGGLTISRTSACLNGDGSGSIEVGYVNASGVQVHHRVVTIPAPGSKRPISDNLGNPIAPVSDGLQAANAAWATALDAVLGQAIKDGKLGL